MPLCSQQVHAKVNIFQQEVRTCNVAAYSCKLRWIWYSMNMQLFKQQTEAAYVELEQTSANIFSNIGHPWF